MKRPWLPSSRGEQNPALPQFVVTSHPLVRTQAVASEELKSEWRFQSQVGFGRNVFKMWPGKPLLRGI